MGKSHKLHVVRDLAGKIVGVGADAEDAARIAKDHADLGRGAARVTEEDETEEIAKLPVEAGEGPGAAPTA